MKTSIVLCRLVERLVEEPGMDEFGAALSEAAIEFGFDSFAYLILPRDPHGPPELISTNPEGWTAHYLRSRYEQVDPVINSALARPAFFAPKFSAPMSALGHEQTSRHVRVMSVISLKADIHQRCLHVRLVPLADIRRRPDEHSMAPLERRQGTGRRPRGPREFERWR
jgi:Autoinducer binding domain